MKFAICLIYIKITELVLGTVFLETGNIKTNYTVSMKISFFFLWRMIQFLHPEYIKLRGSNYLTTILHPFYSDLNLTYTFLTKLPFTTVFDLSDLRVSKIRVITIEENTIQYHCSNNNGLL